MGWFDALKRPFELRKLKKEQIEQLKTIIGQAVDDLKITQSEIKQINRFFQESELSPEDYYRVTEEVFRSVVQRAIADRRVTQREQDGLIHLTEKLHVSPETVNWMMEEIRIFSLLHAYESTHELPQLNVPIILQRNEIGHFSIPANLLEERVIRRGYSGGSQGVSIRIMKGVSYRVGQSKGQFHSEKGIVPVSTGHFVVTNKRLVFSGDNKSASHPLSKLLDMRLYSDAFQYSVVGRQSPIIIGLSQPSYAELCGVVVSRAVENV